MAKEKIDTNNEYIDANANDFSNAVRELLVLEREAYEVLKQRKANVLAAVKLEMTVPAGREVKRTAYTAWGQWQIIVGDVIKAKTKDSVKRLSLAEWQAQNDTLGQRQ
jgi:hypothetical protein